MPDPDPNPAPHRTIAPGELARIARGQAIWAAIAAVAMLYFGFTTDFVDPSFSAQLLLYTLKGGGIVMAISAILLLTGRPFALLFDGIGAMLIGAALILSGVLWFGVVKTVDFQGILDLIFGYLFFTSGKRSFSDYSLANPLFVDRADSDAPEE